MKNYLKLIMYRMFVYIVLITPGVLFDYTNGKYGIYYSYEFVWILTMISGLIGVIIMGEKT